MFQGVGRLTLFVALLASTAVNALPRGLLAPRDSSLSLPSDDNFYQPPENYENKEPGTILRSRQLLGQLQALNHIKENISDGYQLLYRTTNSHGDAEATVTTVLIPHNAKSTQLLSYQTFEDSAEFYCAPSFALQQGSEDPTGNINSEIAFINAALLENGHTTLDPIKAVLKSIDTTVISSDAKTVMWGYYGGSIPTQFAAQLQPYYAPYLSDSLFGATAGGIIANLSATLTRIDNTGFADPGFGGLKGFTQEYPKVEDYVEKHLVSHKKDDFHHAGTLCLEPLEDKFSNVSIFCFLDNDYDILHEESLKLIFHGNIMGKHTPQIPQFGGKIQYHKDVESEHAVLAVTGSPEATAWVEDRFAGKEVKDGYSISTLVTSLESSGAANILGELIVENFQRVIASSRRTATSWADKAEDKAEDAKDKVENAIGVWLD